MTVEVIQKVSYETIDEKISTLKSIDITILKSRLIRGCILKDIKDKKEYINVDSEGSTSWYQFLEAIGIEAETARSDMRIYETFWELLEKYPHLTPNLKYYRLKQMLPLVTGAEPEHKVVELLEISTIANRRDFDNTIRELKGLVPTDNCIDVINCNKIKQIYEKCTYCGVYIRREDLE